MTLCFLYITFLIAVKKIKEGCILVIMLKFFKEPEEKEVIQKLVIEEMESVCKLDVPLIADCGWGKNWLEAH